MSGAFRLVLVGAGITIASVAVFLFAAWLFPGNPGRFYRIFAITTLLAAVLWRLLFHDRPEKPE